MMSAGKVEKAKIIEAVKVAEPLIPPSNLDKAADAFIAQGKDFCEQEKTDVLEGDEAKREICESGFLDGVLRDADELEKYFKDNGIPEVAKRLAEGDRFVRYPYKGSTGNNPRRWWNYYLWKVADGDPALKAKLEADAKPAEASEGKSPLGINLKKLQMHTPAPWDDAASSEGATEEMKNGTFTLDAEGTYSLAKRPSYAVGVVGNLEHKDNAGFDPDSVVSATKRGLTGRKLETEGGAGLSLTLPLNGPLDMEVPQLDLVFASPLAKELAEKAKARWGDKAAQIYLNAARTTFERTDEDGFPGLWRVMTQEGAALFESLLSGSNLPTKREVENLASFFELQPSGLIDFLALWSGRSVSEIKTGLSSKGIDLERFEASRKFFLEPLPHSTLEIERLFEDVLEKAGTLGLTKQFKLADDFDDNPSVSTIKLPTNPEKLKTALGLDGYAKALAEKEQKIADALGVKKEDLKKAADAAKEEYPFELVAGKNDQDNPWRVDARVNKFRNAKLGENVATIEAEVVAKVKSDWTLNPYPVLEAGVPFPLYQSDKGILRGATLIIAGEYDGPAFTAKPEDAAHVFVGVAILKLKLEQWTKWNADFQWIGIGLKPKDGDFTPVKNIFTGKLRADLYQGLYAEGSVTRVLQGDTTQQTSPNGLNDGTSGGGNGGFTTEVGRNETISSLELGYKISPITLGAVYTHMTSCDVLTGEDCTSRYFVGVAFTAKF